MAAAAAAGTTQLIFDNSDMTFLGLNILGHDVLHDYGDAGDKRWKYCKNSIQLFLDEIANRRERGQRGGFFFSQSKIHKSSSKQRARQTKQRARQTEQRARQTEQQAIKRARMLEKLFQTALLESIQQAKAPAPALAPVAEGPRGPGTGGPEPGSESETGSVSPMDQDKTLETQAQEIQSEILSIAGIQIKQFEDFINQNNDLLDDLQSKVDEYIKLQIQIEGNDYNSYIYSYADQIATVAQLNCLSLYTNQEQDYIPKDPVTDRYESLFSFCLRLFNPNISDTDIKYYFSEEGAAPKDIDFFTYLGYKFFMFLLPNVVNNSLDEIQDEVTEIVQVIPQPEDDKLQVPNSSFELMSKCLLKFINNNNIVFSVFDFVKSAEPHEERDDAVGDEAGAGDMDTSLSGGKKLNNNHQIGGGVDDADVLLAQQDVEHGERQYRPLIDNINNFIINQFKIPPILTDDYRNELSNILNEQTELLKNYYQGNEIDINEYRKNIESIKTYFSKTIIFGRNTEEAPYKKFLNPSYFDGIDLCFPTITEGGRRTRSTRNNPLDFRTKLINYIESQLIDKFEAYITSKKQTLENIVKRLEEQTKRENSGSLTPKQREVVNDFASFIAKSALIVNNVCDQSGKLIVPYTKEDIEKDDTLLKTQIQILYGRARIMNTRDARTWVEPLGTVKDIDTVLIDNAKTTDLSDYIYSEDNILCGRCQRYIINNAAILTNADAKKTFCPLTSIIDAQSTCSWPTGNNTTFASGIEYGNMNFTINNGTNNYFYNGYLENVGENIQQDGIPNNNITLGIHFKNKNNNNFEYSYRLTFKPNKKVLEASTVLTTMLDKLYKKLPETKKVENGLVFSFILTQRDQYLTKYLPTVYNILFKGTGDLFQEINAVSDRSSYNPIPPNYSGDGIIAQIPPTRSRLFLANDRPSAVRFGYMLIKGQNGINQYAYGGYYPKEEGNTVIFKREEFGNICGNCQAGGARSGGKKKKKNNTLKKNHLNKKHNKKGSSLKKSSKSKSNSKSYSKKIVKSKTFKHNNSLYKHKRRNNKKSYKRKKYSLKKEH